MSEVKSFWCHEASNVLCVRASDFDNVTRLFLDAAERAVASERREKELQQRLTAADVLEGLLRRVYDADLAARHHQPYNVSKLMDEIEAALKPAEGGGDA